MFRVPERFSVASGMSGKERVVSFVPSRVGRAASPLAAGNRDVHVDVMGGADASRPESGKKMRPHISGHSLWHDGHRRAGTARPTHPCAWKNTRPGKGCPNPCKARPIGRRSRFQRKERKGGRAFAFLALESWRSLRRAYSTGQGVMCQISLAYSAMVRSVLNLPELAMFIRHMRAQREGCS